MSCEYRQMEDIMMNGKLQESKDEVDAASIDSDILNPFVHRIEFNTTYDKLKVSLKNTLISHSHVIIQPFSTFLYSLLLIQW